MLRRAVRHRGRVSRAGGRFSPGSIANLRAWYKSDTGLTGSSPITAWADKAGNGWGLTTSTGPVVAAADLNGKDTVSFTAASSQFLTVAGFSNGSNINEYTMAGVFRFSNDASFAMLVSVGDPAFEELRNNGGSEQLAGVSNAATALDPVARADQWLIVVYTRTSAGNLELFINGTSVATASGGIANVPSGSLNLGRRSTGMFFATYRTPEVMFYSRAIGTAQRNALESYLGEEYALP